MNQTFSSLLISSSLFFPGVVQEKSELELPINNYLPIEIVKSDIAEEMNLKLIEKQRNLEIAHEILEHRALQKAKKEEEERLKKEEELKWKTFNATHYSPFCPTGCIGVTKTGYNVANTIYYQGMRIIAVDPSYIPLYSIVEVKYPYGNFKAVAIDTGGAIKGHRVDILVPSEKKAYQLGRFNVKIKIVGSLKK